MKKILFLLLLCFLAVSTSLQAEHYGPTNDFQADWVLAAGLPEPVSPNLWFAFRKSFELDAVPEKALCRIACDSKYWLYVNGKPVVFEGQLKRGPTPEDTYFDVVDLAGSLQQGKNTVAVLMWYFGKEGFSHKSSGSPGFLFDASTNGPAGLRLLSDGDWKGKILSNLDNDQRGFAPYDIKTEDPQPNFRLPESNIRYDARFEFPGDWKAVEFDDSGWAPVKIVGKPPIGPWNKLFERPIPHWKDFGLKNYLNAADIPAVSGADPIRCRLPYNAQITPYLKIEAPAGLKIDMRTDDYMGGSEYNVRAEYITKDGVQEYESLGWMNGQEMIYTMPSGIKILELKFRETGFNSEFAGSFECDDPFYNKLWEKARRTLYITMRDTYFDCPDRERAQWWGDAVNELGEAFYALDPKSATLAKKGMYELMRWQKENGTIFSPCPAGNWDKELPLQMLASIGPYGFGTWYRYANDYTPLHDLYPRIERYMDVWQFGDDNLILHRTGAWDGGDWGENIDLRVLANCWYYLALRSQFEMSRIVENDWNMQKNRVKADRIADHFDKMFWNGKEYRDPKYAGKTDDRANAMAVIAGLAKKENYPAIRKVLLEQKHASPYMEKYVLEALFKMGYEDDALARMKERFTKMVENEEYSTLWEGWGIGSEGYGGGTTNHAWSGGGLTLLSQYATGVQLPDGGNFKNFVIAPQMGPLKWIRSTTPTQFGDIRVELNRSESAFSLKLTVPPETRAHVKIPTKYVASLGSLTAKAEQAAQEPPSAWSDESANGFYYAVFPTGSWSIEGQAGK